MVLTVSGDQSFSLSATQRNERNILVKLQRSHATKQLFHDLWHERKAIEAVVAHHLGRIDRSTCTVQDMSTWLIGQFNVCVIVHIHDGDDKISKKIFRCPMYHKVGEQYTPGSVDEKMRAEVATYAWIETNSADIPIPFLHGFGLSSGLQVWHLCLDEDDGYLTRKLLTVHSSTARHGLHSRSVRKKIRSPVLAVRIHRPRQNALRHFTGVPCDRPDPHAKPVSRDQSNHALSRQQKITTHWLASVQ
jgi:hypothetical protein